MHFRSNIALVVDREWNISALEYFEQIISNFVHVAALCSVWLRNIHSFISYRLDRFLFVLVLCLSPIDAACVVHATLTFARTIKRDLFIINFQSKDLLQWKFKESCLWLRWKKIDCWMCSWLLGRSFCLEHIFFRLRNFALSLGPKAPAQCWDRKINPINHPVNRGFRRFLIFSF